MTTKYAAATNVSVEKSRGEIESTLARWGVVEHAFTTRRDTAEIQFILKGRLMLFRLKLPDRDDREFTHHSRGKRTDEAAFKAWDQSCRSAWRALALAIKAKFAAVDAGIATIDQEFLAYIVTDSGETVHQRLAPALEALPHGAPLQLTAGHHG